MKTTLKGLGNAVITTEHESNTEKAETKTETRDDVSYERCSAIPPFSAFRLFIW